MLGFSSADAPAVSAVVPTTTAQDEPPDSEPDVVAPRPHNIEPSTSIESSRHQPKPAGSKRYSSLDDSEAEPEQDYSQDEPEHVAKRQRVSQAYAYDSSDSSSSNAHEGAAAAHGSQMARDSDEDVKAPYVRRATVEEKYKAGSLKRKAEVLQTSSRWREHCEKSSRQLVDCTPQPSSSSTSEQPVVDKTGWNRVHESHQRALIKDVLFCTRCGYFMVKRAQSLASPCLGRPKHADSTAKLKRMLDGRHPDRKVLMWPDGTSTAVIVPPIYLD